jgi:hypothetical protein
MKLITTKFMTTTKNQTEKKTKTLNVKKTSNEELLIKWGFITCFKGEIFIRCNSKGHVNWDIASVYSKNSLINRKVNYFI